MHTNTTINARMKQTSQSFAHRLALKVLVTVLIVMAITLTMTFIVAYRSMSGEVRGRYLGIMNVVAEKMYTNIKCIEIGAVNALDEVEHHMASPEAVMAALEKEMHLNNYVEGYFAAFEPDYFPQQGKWYEPYVHKMGNGQFKAEQVGSKRHDYLRTDWYQRAMKETKGFWTHPYTYTDSTGYGGVFCTFVMPIHDEEGKVVGVCGADLLLNNLIKDLHKIDDDSRNEGVQNIHWRFSHLKFYSFIIDNDGTFIAHPDSNRVLKENIRSYVGKNPFTKEGEEVIANMTQGHSGIDPVVVDDIFSDVFYTPLKSTDWSLAVVVPKRALVYPIIILLLGMLTATGMGQLLVWATCRRNVKRFTKPLEDFTQSANEVAKGNFEAPLPELKYKDEISELRDSFASMQHSIVKYIEDLEQTTAKKASMEGELNVARKIQMAMVPRKFPPFKKRHDIDIYGSLTPAKAVGGDLFDFFIRDEKLFFCIGDVSGKGVPASLFMAATRNLFRSSAMHVTMPEKIVKQINDTMCEGNDNNMFVTIFVGVLDLSTGHLDYCNGGHDAPLMIDRNGVSRLPVIPNGLVGLMPFMTFKGQETEMEPETTIFLFTDGLTESIQINGDTKQLFGIERVMAIAQEAVTPEQQQPKAFIEKMQKAMYDFVGDAEQSDDLTLLAIRYLGQQ